MRLSVLAIVLVCCTLTSAQTNKSFSKDSLSFDYPSDWILTDDSNSDAQQLILRKADSDVQITVFAHKGRTAPEKMADAKKAFIDPYIAATSKQFVQMGAKPEQAPAESHIGQASAEGVTISASLGGEAGAAQIYWALIGRRVVVLTLFGPDKQTKQMAAAWDLVRNSLAVQDAKATPAPKPSP
jgi:hypothetical protein